MVRTGGSAREKRRPRRAPRGSAAVLAAVTMPVLLMMFTLAIAYGFLVDARQKFDHASDSLASTYAEVALMSPSPRWLNTPIDTASIATAHGLSADKFTTAGVIPYYTAGPGALRPDAWAPAVLKVTTQYREPEMGVGGLVRNLLSGSAPALNQVASARVSQVQLGTFNMARERVMFVLDFSKSMRLKYDNDETKTGLEVMRETGAAVINQFSGVFNAGLLTFSDNSEGDDPSLGLVTAQPGMQTPGGNDYNQQTTKMVDQIENQKTLGNGTDIASAIYKAQKMLEAGESQGTDQFSNQRIILITDGEPDAGEGVISTQYETRVAEAELQAKRAVDTAWAAAITTQVVFMERTKSLSTAVPFLQSISGSNLKAGNANNFKSDAGDYSQIITWLEQQAVYPICYSSYRLGTDLQPNVPIGLLPGQGEILRAYFDTGANGSNQERQIATVLWGMDQKDEFLNRTRAMGATIPRDNQNFDLTALDNPDNLVVWYNNENGRLALSPIMCAAMFSNQNQNRSMRVRLRWGSPRPVQPGHEAMENDYTGVR